LQDVDNDARTLDKLLDGVGCTVEDSHMWIAPFYKATASTDMKATFAGTDKDSSTLGNILRIDFGQKQEVAGLNMWNYNKSAEDTSRGVREFSVYCDERYVATFLCRKAPGHIHFDFKQVVLLDQPPCTESRSGRFGVPQVAPRIPSRGRGERSPGPGGRSGRHDRSRERARSRGPAEMPHGETTGVQQQYETPLHPCGFIVKILLMNTWNDIHYVGLDGVELYDLAGLPLRPKRAHSNQGSVRNLKGMEMDIRTEENLLYGDPAASGRMWLAPFVRQPPNSVEFVFDAPTHISCVHFWNYSRTPSRGARDIEIYVDDLLVYQGILRQEDAADKSSSHPQAGAGIRRKGEAVLFTMSPEIVERERGCVYLPGEKELVNFFDESGHVDLWGARRGAPVGPLPERPMTALTHAQ